MGVHESMKELIMRDGIFYVIFVSVFLTGCGADDNQVPPGANISLTPEFREWEIVPNDVTIPDTGEERCVVLPENYVDFPVNISVTDSQDRAIDKANVVISLSGTEALAPNYTRVMELYDDTNGDFHADPEELVSGIGAGFYRTRTDKYTGTISLIVRAFLSCPFKVQLEATAGTASATTTFEAVDVSEDDEEEGE